MSEEKPVCLVCKQNSDKVPLIPVQYQQQSYYVCPQHLPVLIHKPQALVGILPDAEKLAAHSHDD